MHAHNAFPYDGQFVNRLDRVLATTLPVMVEQDLFWYTDATTGKSKSVIAQLLAQRLNVATTYLADIKRQYAGHGNHLAMVGEVLESMINLSPSQVSPGSDRQSDPRM